LKSSSRSGVSRTESHDIADSGTADRIALDASDADHGLRIDVFLAGRLAGMSRSGAQRLISEGAVTVDGKAVLKSRRVSRGERYFVELRAPDAPDAAAAENIPLDIVYEDGDVVVVNKPRGMVVHPAPGHSSGTLVNALLWHCGDSLSGIGGCRRPGIVHRIDKDTSGLIIAAKNNAAHVSLSGQLRNRSLTRVYETVVHGTMRDLSGTIDAPIGRHAADRKRQAVAPASASSRSAVTHYEVLRSYARHTHLRCRLETGRTHQIRVHLAYIGRPVVGDMVYGRRAQNFGLHGQCLHARELMFRHPVTGGTVALTTPLPDYFTDVLSRL
jgi:23S rRNA pseudouridine1911/1915/1917 synthase